MSISKEGKYLQPVLINYRFSSDWMYTYLCFKLIVEVGIIKLNETEEQGTFLRNGVILGNFLLHILLQEGHVAQEATRKGPQQLEQQLNLRVVTPIKRESG